MTHVPLVTEDSSLGNGTMPGFVVAAFNRVARQSIAMMA